MSGLWDVCEACGSKDIVFYAEVVNGLDMIQALCEKCGETWEDFTENYPELGESK